MIRKVRQSGGAWTLAFAAMGLAACGGIGDGVGPAAIEIRLNSATEDAEVFACLAASPQLVVTFTDGQLGDFVRRATWSSSDESVVIVSDGTLAAPNGFYLTGVVLPVSEGTATIRADYVGLSAEIDVTVSPTRLEVSPVERRVIGGSQLTMRATAILEGRDAVRALDLTSDGIWSTADAAGGEQAATSINSVTGVLLAERGIAGTDTVNYRVDFCNREASAPITVLDQQLLDLTVGLADDPDTPITSLLLPEDVSVPLAVTGHYDGGHTQSFTSAVTIVSDNAAVALAGLRGAGVVSTIIGAEPGDSATLSISYDPDSTVEGDELGTDPIVVTVADAPLVPESLVISPADALILPATGLSYTVSGLFSGPDGDFARDMTRDVLWSSSNLLTASVSNVNGSRGFAIGSGTVLGKLTVAATRLNDDGPDTAPVANLTVGAEVDEDGERFNVIGLNALTISAEDNTLVRGERLRLKAIGELDNGLITTAQDLSLSVVWSSSDETVARVANGASLKGEVVVVTDEVDREVTLRADYFITDVQEQPVFAEFVLTANPGEMNDAAR